MAKNTIKANIARNVLQVHPASMPVFCIITPSPALLLSTQKHKSQI